MDASGLLSKVLKTFVGSKTDRDYKELSPIIDEVAIHFNTYATISNDELRAKTITLKAKIAEKTKAKDDEIVTLKAQTDSDLTLSINDKEAIYFINLLKNDII